MNEYLDIAEQNFYKLLVNKKINLDKILSDDNEDFEFTVYPDDAPENFGITVGQLVIACSVMNKKPEELRDMTLKEKTQLEAELVHDLLSQTELEIEFPVLGSLASGTVVLEIGRGQSRELVQLVKRVSRADNYFACLETTEDKEETLKEFPAFINIFTGERFKEVANNKRRTVYLGEIYANTKTPKANVIDLGDGYLADYISMAQSRGDFFDIEYIGNSFEFSVR